MRKHFTVIDSFNVPEKRQSAVLAAGTWFILEGRLSGTDSAPRNAQEVTIQLPGGSTRQAFIELVEVKHSVVAVRLSGLEGGDAPRLSTFDAELA
jgi:plastocyanin domain-containing protein